MMDYWQVYIYIKEIIFKKLTILILLMIGPSSGSVVSAALSYVKQQSTTQESSTRVLCILNDTARNYSTTLLSDEWLLENDLMDDEMSRKLEYQRSEKYRAVRKKKFTLNILIKRICLINSI